VLDRKRFAAWKILLTLAMLLLWENRAMAYVGPGAGLELIPYFLGLLLMVGSALVAFLLYPIHALIRYVRGKKAPQAVTEQTTSNQPAADPPDEGPQSQSGSPGKKGKPKTGLDVVGILAGGVAVGYLGLVGAAYFGLVGDKPPEIPPVNSQSSPREREEPPLQGKHPFIRNIR
jgi:hypothetical protein